MQAQDEVHDLAMKINRMEQETELAEFQMNRLREVEGIIEGLAEVRLCSTIMNPARLILNTDIKY